MYGDSYVECMVKGLPCIYVPSFRMVDTRLLGLEYCEAGVWYRY